MKKPKKLSRKNCRLLLIGLLAILLLLSAGIVVWRHPYRVVALWRRIEEKVCTSGQNVGLEDGAPDFVEKDYLPINEYSRPGETLEQVNGIVIHYVGNPGTSAKANRNYFAGLATSGATYASSHFIVGLEGEILQCVPLNEIAYASNSRNDDTISIENCHPDETGQFNSQTYASLVRLAGWLAWHYDLEEEQILRHYDVKGKLCPLYYVEHEDAWLALREDIMEEKVSLEASASQNVA